MGGADVPATGSCYNAIMAVTVSNATAANLTYSASMGRSIRAWDPRNSLELL